MRLVVAFRAAASVGVMCLLIAQAAPAARRVPLPPRTKCRRSVPRDRGPGRLRPDSNPRTYAEFVRQWAVWTKVEQWGAQEFTEKFVTRTKENAERSKQYWTPSMEQQLRAAAPNCWRDIRQVLDEATALEGARP
ncbi:MAG: hypothetical protein HYS05_11805 [Acidobacteria bacterium]|nr:hypothetical protein [Acidobacteriota bacterium]